MKRLLALAAALLLVPLLVRLLLAQSPASTAQLVYTTVPSKNWVVIVDSATSSVVNTITIAAPTATGPGTRPSSVAFTPDAKFAYVVNQGCDATGSTVSVIDSGQELVVATIPVPGCPHEIALAPDGLHGYVTTLLPSGVGAVIVLDLTTKAVVTTVNLTASDNPKGLAVSPTGDVVRFGKSDGIYALATGTNTLTSTVIPDIQFPGTNCPVGEIAGTPDGNFLLVTCFANEAVLLDAHTGRAIFNALVSCTIGAPAITPDGTKAFVPDSECGGILDISMATGVSKLFFLPGSSQPTSRRIAFASDGTEAFASGFYNCCSQAGQADVDVFNPVNDSPIADVTVASAPTSGSVGIAVMPTTVSTASTTTTVVSSVSPSAFGQQVSFTATVIPTQSSSLTPTGNVTFNDGSTVLGTVALTSGTAIFNTAGLAVGTHTIAASYGGDNNFGSSTSAALTQVVNQAGTTTTLAASPNPANIGQSVTFTATLSVVAPGAGTPTGTVTFKDGTTTLGTVVVNSAGNATFSSSSLAVGSHSVTAVYGGDATFTGSTSTVVTVAVQGPVQIMVNETVHVADAASFPDVFDPENVKVTDAVWVAPLIQVSAPVVEFSAGSIGFSGQSGSQTIIVSDIGTASLSVTSASISGALQFAITQVACSNNATSFSTMLPSGGACLVTIGYSASATPANDNGTLLFTDNAALSNLASIPAGSSFTQSIPLSGIGATTGPPPPPPAVVPVMDNETIHVTDTETFPDVFDAEAVHVADTVFVTPLIQVSAPVAEFSAGTLGFSGQSGSQTITVSDIGTASLTVASATISGGSQFAITQVACSNNATSFSTMLPSGGACLVTIGYSASATPANDNGTLVFTDNAALSNPASIPAGSNYTQSLPLNGSGTTTPPPPPPAVVTIPPISETIKVTDTSSFPDVFDAEKITVTDQVSIQVLNATTTSISITVGTVYGSPAGVMVSVSSSTAAVTGNVALSVDGGTPSTMSLTNGSATFNLGILKAGNQSLSANFAPQGNLLASSAQATFVVNPATPAITWTNPSAIILGTALSAVQLNATASVPGTFAYNPPAGALLTAGSHLLSVTFTPADTVDYTTAAATVTITVLNTGVGTGVNVTPVDTTTGTTPVTLSFTNVTTAGNTGLITSSSGPAAPAGFQPGVPLVYYNLSTSATFSGTATVCINYTGVTFPNTGAPQLFHYQNGVWINITTNVNTLNLIVCGATASLSPFALFAPLPVLTITANSFSRQYGAPDPTLTAAYSGFVNGDTPASLSGTLACSSTDTVSSSVGNYVINCSGLSSPKYVIRYAPGVLTIIPAPLTVAVANAQRVYGAANPLLTGTIMGIQNGDNITATYSTTATPTSPVGAYAIVPTLVDPIGKLNNYKVTLINGTLTVIQVSTTTTLSVSPNPSNFGQSVTLAATVAPVAPGAGTATGKVTFFDGSAALGTSILNSADTATFTTSSLAAANHSLTASYSGDSNFSRSSSSAVSDQVQCGVLMSLSSSTVPLGGTITVTGKVISCSTTTQTVVVQFSLSGPSQPNNCSSTKSVMFTTAPFSLAPKLSQTVSFPFKIPSGVCLGTYTITATTLVNSSPVSTSTATLTITAH